VTGTFFQATQPVSIAATVTVTGAGGTFPVTDSGGTLTVDAPVGTPVFVRLSDGTNAIATLPVSLASVPSHPVTNAGTFAVQVSSALPAGTNNIGDVDVLTLPALATGSNTIGNIGTITTSITPGTAAANLGKAEDAAHTTGDTGVMALAVQRNTAASGAADGDYATLNVDSTGHLWTRIGLALPAGTNNIGDVDVLSLPATPTGSNVIGSVAARLDASSMSDGAGTALVPKFAAIAAASSGDNTIVAAVSAKKIRVLAFRLKAATASSAAVACYWRNGAGGSALEGGASNTTPLDKTGAAGAGGETAQFNPVGWFETSSNTALVLNLSAAQAVTGSITYVEV
jgi:hypothetical protein